MEQDNLAEVKSNVWHSEVNVWFAIYGLAFMASIVSATLLTAI